MKEKTEQTIFGDVQRLSTSIMHYFKCPGCSDCSSTSTEVRNRHFLRDYESEFERDVDRFKVTLSEEVNQSADNLRAELAASIYLNQLSSQMDSMLKKEVEKLIGNLVSQSQSLIEEQKKVSFEDWWKKMADVILKKINLEEEDSTPVKASVQSKITSLLRSDVHRYHQKKPNVPSTFFENGFDVQQSHIRRGKPGEFEGESQDRHRTH